MKLSTYFTLSEMIQSGYATRHGIDNTPNAEAMANLRYTAEQLDRVRSLLGVPVLISSGYRCEKVNTAINGSKNSQHLRGQAVDFTAPSFGNPEQIAKAIANSHIPFDQLILEYGAWVHVSFTKNPRGQILTIDRNGTRQGLPK